MVFKNKWLEDVFKVFVGVLIASINATMLVVKLNSTCDGFSKRKARGSSCVTSQFCPFFWSDMLCNQAMGRSNVWKRWCSSFFTLCGKVHSSKFCGAGRGHLFVGDIRSNASEGCKGDIPASIHCC